MPLNREIRKVLVIGSGPIIIGQAAEFDYAGTQACRALKEEGLEVVLVNSNPATIMTDKDIADEVYIEPLNVETLRKVIAIERPDSVLPTLGGQTGLNLAMELSESGILEEYGVKMLGTSAQAIRMAEDRQDFKDAMLKLGEPCIASKVVKSYPDALDFAREIGLPVIVRPAYTLGGTGGGIAYTEAELEKICKNGLRLSRVGEALIEKCISGWKEIEYEVMRDCANNCITICNMENVDPVGVHTGDSIVVAPTQTLSAKECAMLRDSALKIIEAIGIEGGCNVQFALHPTSMDYAVIEVNPRVSRSSALASKATGYPIAKVAAKVALGFTLDEIKNAVTGTTYAASEPNIDYIVVKVPRWPFDKFVYADRTLGTQMKATGEVMAISNCFEGGLMKAIRSLEQKLHSLELPKLTPLGKNEVTELLHRLDDERLFVVAEAIRKGVTLKEIHEITMIDLWFLRKIAGIVEVENKLKQGQWDLALLRKAKQFGFTDMVIAKLTGKDRREIKQLRLDAGILPTFKQVDTCAGEYAAASPYYYSTYDQENEVDPATDKKKIIVLGSGPIRIGQGIEFDYCSVHSLWALKKYGCETIIINNNPETVSTDFDIADKLYFEPLTHEDVENIMDLEKPYGAIVQFGGQTAIKLTETLKEIGVRVLGTAPDDIDAAEDRERFDEILNQCQIPRPAGRTVFTEEEAIAAANDLGYPVLVRPSYVLGGQGMEIAANEEEVKEYMAIINRVKQKHPILVDKYISGKEVEVDAICDGEDILIPGIMEHMERAGVHSGDSISVYPAQSLNASVKATIIDYTKRLANALHVIGLINIQFIVMNGEVYVIEVNPRSSRTVPYISKVTGVQMVDYATRCVLGEKLRDMGVPTGIWPEGHHICVKMPVFSFEKLRSVDTSLGPEMKSTGEVLGVADSFPEAIVKAFYGAGINISTRGNLLVTVNDADKREVVDIVKGYHALGFGVYATEGTGDFLIENGVNVVKVDKAREGKPNILDLIGSGNINLVINTPTEGRQVNRDGFMIRRTAVEKSIPCLTSLDTAKALLTSLYLVNKDQVGVVDMAKL